MEDKRSNSTNDLSGVIIESNETANHKESRDKREQSSYLIDLFAVIGVLIVLMTLISSIGAILISTNSTSRGFSLFLSYSIPLTLAIVFAISLFKRKGYQNVWPKLSISTLNAPFVLYGTLLITLASVVLEPVLSIFPSEWITNLNKGIGDGGWSILTAVVMAPILEEILFRGVIQGSAYSKYGALKSILISSAAFGIIHLIPQQVIYAFVAGIILGYIYWRTQSILSVIIVHALNNGIAFIQKIIFGDDISNSSMKELISSDTLYWIVYSIVTIFFITALILLVQQTSKAEKTD